MKKKVFALALLTATATSFAAPISTPNNVNDTPIISNGGGTVGGGQCQAYQSDGATVSLSGGETLVFYGGGNPAINGDWNYWYSRYITSVKPFGGYLSTKTTYSGIAYLKTKYFGIYSNYAYYWDDRLFYSGKAIGLFARDSDQQSDFIAGAGASGGGGGCTYDLKFSGGGGWRGEGDHLAGISYPISINSGFNFYNFFDNTTYDYDPEYWQDFNRQMFGGVGFYNGIGDRGYNTDARKPYYYGGGGASSISAFYNYYTKQYTSLPLSYTITSGGSSDEPILYVCK